MHVACIIFFFVSLRFCRILFKILPQNGFYAVDVYVWSNPSSSWRYMACTLLNIEINFYSPNSSCKTHLLSWLLLQMQHIMHVAFTIYCIVIFVLWLIVLWHVHHFLTRLITINQFLLMTFQWGFLKDMRQ